MESTLTNAELTVLGLLAERPRYGYDIERTIETRGMRQWTEIGFSSIYYLLKRLEARGLVAASAPPEQRGGRTRRIYAITPEGRRACSRSTREALAHPHPTYPAILVGLANSPLLTTEEVRAALHERRARLDEQVATIQSTQAAQEPVPGFVAAIFSYAITLLTAERAWLTETIQSMEQRNDKD
jgi:DNA-binding PadR family transcriptional regulator